MISSAALRQPVPPHVKEERIKARAFDEYKTEVPAEKHSPSNHTAAAAAPAPAAIPPTLRQIKEEGVRGVEDGERRQLQQRRAINILLLQKTEA